MRHLRSGAGTRAGATGAWPEHEQEHNHKQGTQLQIKEFVLHWVVARGRRPACVSESVSGGGRERRGLASVIRLVRSQPGHGAELVLEGLEPSWKPAERDSERVADPDFVRQRASERCCERVVGPGWCQAVFRQFKQSTRD